MPPPPNVGIPIMPPPAVSPTDTTLYVPEGFVYTQYKAAAREVDNTNNPWYVRAGFFVLGSAAAPLAIAEEYIARPITNVPHVVYNGSVHLGEHIARASMWADQGEYAEATVDGLMAVESFAEAFVAGASVAVPIAGAVESRAVSTTAAAVESKVVTTTAPKALTPPPENPFLNLDPGEIERALANMKPGPLYKIPVSIAEAGTPLESLVPVSRWGRPGLQAGDWVMPGPPSRVNYGFSFKWDPNPLNIPAPFSAGEAFMVPAEHVKWPTGWGLDGWWKGLFNQRIYKPY